MSQHQGLPVAGYNPQSDNAVARVNEHKQLEERLLRRIEQMLAAEKGIYDPRMALNRAVFKPGRVKLPEDAAA